MGKSPTLPATLLKLGDHVDAGWGGGGFCINDPFHGFLLSLPGHRQHSPQPTVSPVGSEPGVTPWLTPLRPPQGTGEARRGRDCSAAAGEAEQSSASSASTEEAARKHDLYLVKVIYVPAEGLRRRCGKGWALV